MGAESISISYTTVISNKNNRDLAKYNVKCKYNSADTVIYAPCALSVYVYATSSLKYIHYIIYINKKCVKTRKPHS